MVTGDPLWSPRLSHIPRSDQDNNNINNSYIGEESFASTASSSQSVLLSDAPTPQNTYCAQDGFGDVSMAASSMEEVLADGGGAGDVSIRPSLASTSSISGQRSSFHSSPSTRLLPTSTRSSSFEPSIPHSLKPIPKPPLSLRSSEQTSSELLTQQSTNTSSFSTPLATPLTESEGVKSIFTSDQDGQVGSSSGSRRSKVDVDTQRLQQLGYDAVLGRDYTFWSSLSISTINIGCLQGAVYAVPGAFSYGGPLMILIAWPISGLFSLFLVLVLAELASAYPVTGAMASWAWKCARGGVGHERAWGWLMGGVVLGGHAANIILVSWETCKITAGVMTLAFDYQVQSWHQVLFFIAILLVCGVTGSMSWGRSHRFWLISGAYFACVWLIFNISLVISVTRNPHRSLSSQYLNTSGWGSRFYVGLLGWQLCTIASGADASAHMAEETRKPSRNVPNAMVSSMVVTYVAAYISIILLLLAVRPEDATTLKAHAFPAGQILAAALSEKGAIGISCLLITVLVLQVLAQLQASSRFVFALARDNAMPFSKSIRWTNSAKQPVIANWIVIALCLPFALLILAADGTLYSVLAVTASSLSYSGYVCPVVLYLLSKRDLQTEGRTSWSLRRLSKPVGCVGIFYGFSVILVQMFPGKSPVTADSISWSPVILVGTALICLLTWVLYGRKHYSGPIRALTKWETGVEIDLQSALSSSRPRASAHSDPLDVTGETILRPSDFSIKVDSDGYPGFSDVHQTVTVGSAKTMDSQQSTTEWRQGNTTGWSTTDEIVSVPELKSRNDSTSSGGTVTERSFRIRDL